MWWYNRHATLGNSATLLDISDATLSARKTKSSYVWLLSGDWKQWYTDNNNRDHETRSCFDEKHGPVTIAWYPYMTQELDSGQEQTLNKELPLKATSLLSRLDEEIA